VLLLAAGFGVASVLQAQAETAGPDEDSDPAVAETAAADANDPDISGLQLDWSQLNVDASTLTIGPASKARLPQAGPAAKCRGRPGTSRMARPRCR